MVACTDVVWMKGQVFDFYRCEGDEFFVSKKSRYGGEVEETKSMLHDRAMPGLEERTRQAGSERELRKPNRRAHVWVAVRLVAISYKHAHVHTYLHTYIHTLRIKTFIHTGGK